MHTETARPTVSRMELDVAGVVTTSHLRERGPDRSRNLIEVRDGQTVVRIVFDPAITVRTERLPRKPRPELAPIQNGSSPYTGSGTLLPPTLAG